MPDADLILVHGTVVTLDRASRVAEAVAVRDGRVVAVGPTDAVAREAGPRTRRIDLRGRTVVPGFFDAHPHVDREGLKARGGLPIAGLRSVDEIVSVVRDAARAAKPGEWIVLMPMGEPPHDYVSRPDQLIGGHFPTRHDLDAAAPDHPVYVRAVWGWWSHRPFPSVANSRALALAGVTRDTPAPYNVEIVRDARGEPTGVFLERNFVPILEYTLFRSLPRFTYEDRVESVRRGARAYGAAGTTATFEGHGLTPAIVRAYGEIRARDELTLRMHTPLSVPSAVLDDARLADLFYQQAAAAGGHGLGDETFRVEGINLGGTADPRIAELVGADYPYEQWAGHFYQAMDRERFVRLGIEAARLGLRISCIVSRDLEYALAGYEAIDRVVPIRDRRWVVIHVNAATPDQLRRMRDLGVVATATPGFLYLAGDRYGLDQLGQGAVPLRELLDAGVPVALGTDGVPYSMLWTMWEALARWDGDARRRLGESRLTREEALRMSVQSGHVLTWSENRRGSIEIGKDADLAVLDANPLTCAEDAIKDIAVDLTITGGRIVHERLQA
ncbi:MAG: amidohydrolase [Gammaproteobacteria bacterium]